jgi:hypothetical protein
MALLYNSIHAKQNWHKPKLQKGWLTTKVDVGDTLGATHNRGPGRMIHRRKWASGVACYCTSTSGSIKAHVPHLFPNIGEFLDLWCLYGGKLS